MPRCTPIRRYRGRRLLPRESQAARRRPDPAPGNVSLTPCRAPRPAATARSNSPCRAMRGAVVLMSSMAAMQGAPRIAGCAASKAFNATLGEGLWAELREQGIDVVVCCAGDMPTPGYARSFKRRAPGMMAPEMAAELTLAALGKGPRFIPGLSNRAIVQMMTRLLPRKAMIRMIEAAMKETCSDRGSAGRWPASRRQARAPGDAGQRPALPGLFPESGEPAVAGPWTRGNSTKASPAAGRWCT